MTVPIYVLSSQLFSCDNEHPRPLFKELYSAFYQIEGCKFTFFASAREYAGGPGDIIGKIEERTQCSFSPNTPWLGTSHLKAWMICMLLGDMRRIQLKPVFFSSSFRTQVLHASYDSSHLDVKKYTHKPLSSQDSYAAVRERLRR